MINLRPLPVPTPSRGVGSRTRSSASSCTGESTRCWARVTLRLPLETCLTMNQSWGYNARDTNFKSPEQVIHALLGAAGRGANLLLNVGPRPDGTIGLEFSERLVAVGKWLETNGKTVYGTRRGPI